MPGLNIGNKPKDWSIPQSTKPFHWKIHDIEFKTFSFHSTINNVWNLYSRWEIPKPTYVMCSHEYEFVFQQIHRLRSCALTQNSPRSLSAHFPIYRRVPDSRVDIGDRISPAWSRIANIWLEYYALHNKMQTILRSCGNTEGTRVLWWPKR